MRVLPIEPKWQGFPSVYDLQIFHANSVTWSAAKYPDQANQLRDAASNTFAGHAEAASAACNAVASSGDTSYADAATAVANSAPSVSSYGVFDDDDAHWDAVSRDVMRIDRGVVALDLACLPLWPGRQPQKIADRWLKMRRDLLTAGQDWDVWVIWYEDRLAGRVRGKERELAYVLIDYKQWEQGPAAINAAIKRRIEALERSNAALPEPAQEPGPVLQVTERGLEVVAQPLGAEFDEVLQKTLHHGLQRVVPKLTDITHKVANRYPELDRVVSEYLDLVAQPFDELDVASIWMVGAGLVAFNAAFANQARDTITEPLEPNHIALLQQAAQLHGAFIHGFPQGRELTDRADQARLSANVIDQIAPPTRRILDALKKAREIVEDQTRNFLSAIDDSLIIHGWESARIGHAAYVVTRNSLIALGKYLILANVGCAAIFGQPLLPILDLDPHVTHQMIRFVTDHAQDVLAFAQPFPELSAWIGAIIDHLDQENKG